jgi:hypothetical protein
MKEGKKKDREAERERGGGVIGKRGVIRKRGVIEKRGRKGLEQGEDCPSSKQMPACSAHPGRDQGPRRAY